MTELCFILGGFGLRLASVCVTKLDGVCSEKDQEVCLEKERGKKLFLGCFVGNLSTSQMKPKREKKQRLQCKEIRFMMANPAEWLGHVLTICKFFLWNR